MLKNEKKKEGKKHWNRATSDLGLLRKSTVRDEPGKRGMLELRGHRCSLGSQARKRNVGREIPEVNVPLGKQPLRASPTSRKEAVHMLSCFLGCACDTLRGE